MHLQFTSFDTYYIFYTRRERNIIYLQFPPHMLTFKHVGKKRLRIGFRRTIRGK